MSSVPACFVALENCNICKRHKMASVLTLYRSRPWVPFVQNVIQFSGSSRHLKSFYDSLGVTPKATQVDIKTAYYNLSKIYHPDKNDGSLEAANKFRDITEAYEVLGNLELRKKYDKGILHRGDQTASSNGADQVDESFSKFYESRAQRSRSAPRNSGVYNFDEWAQAHYGASFARRQAAKDEYAKYTGQMAYHRYIQRHEIMSFCLVILFMAVFFGAVGHDDYDEVKTSTKLSANAKIFPQE